MIYYLIVMKYKEQLISIYQHKIHQNDKNVGPSQHG